MLMARNKLKKRRDLFTIGLNLGISVRKVGWLLEIINKALSRPAEAIVKVYPPSRHAVTEGESSICAASVIPHANWPYNAVVFLFRIDQCNIRFVQPESLATFASFRAVTNGLNWSMLESKFLLWPSKQP